MIILDALVALIILYSLIGLILGITWFSIGKILELDKDSEYWSLVLNSASGLVYFLIVVTIFWLPALFPYIRQWKLRLKFNKDRVPRGPIAAWREILFRPLYYLKEHFFNWYNIQ